MTDVTPPTQTTAGVKADVAKDVADVKTAVADTVKTAEDATVAAKVEALKALGIAEADAKKIIAELKKLWP